MSDFNTFTGKTVDDAIGEACRFFSSERERLEIEIISGGSTGIFGLVGKKKAQIKARRRVDPAVAAMMREEERQAHAASSEARKDSGDEPNRSAAEGAEAPQAVQVEAQPARERERGSRQRDQRRERPQRQREPREKNEGGENGNQPREARESREPREPREQRPQRPRREQAQAKPSRPKPEPRVRSASLDDDLPEGQDTSPASEELLALATEIMQRLLTPILEQEPRMEIEGTASRVNVCIQDEEHSGLLIGREGQTLAALQYLANRIMARRWESPVRVQINTGEYREKQDDSLRKMALYLADKARNLGRPQSTKPLSSYHRRVIHLTLQEDDTIQTRSKGDGPMKRVIIVPRRPKGEAAARPEIQAESRQDPAAYETQDAAHSE
ncbi:MAG: protein jag [Acidobacteriota bacterium]